MSRWKAVKRHIKIVQCVTNEGGFSVAPGQDKK